MGATYTHTKKFIFRCQLYESHKIKEFKNINVVREINQVLYLLSENAKKIPYALYVQSAIVLLFAKSFKLQSGIENTAEESENQVTGFK